MLPRPNRSTVTDRGARAEVREGVERPSGRTPTVRHGPRGLSQADKYSGSGRSDRTRLQGSWVLVACGAALITGRAGTSR